MVASRVEWETEPAPLKSVRLVSEGDWSLKAYRERFGGEPAIRLAWELTALVPSSSSFVASPAHVREFAEHLIKLVDQGERR